MRTEQEKLYSKIRYQIMSWYLDEGDYQPTEEEAKTKSIQAISKVLSSQKQKMREIFKNYWYHAGKWHKAECSFILNDQGNCNCLSDIKQRIKDL